MSAIIITVILFTAAIFFAMIINLASKSKLSSNVMGVAIGIAVVGGLLIYGYGYALQEANPLLAVLEAVIAVCRMFVGVNNFSVVSGTPLFSRVPMIALFWLVHLLALYATASAAITTIGARAVKRLRLYLLRRGDLAIIFGCNNDSLAFASGLAEQDRKKSIVFVDDAPAAPADSILDTIGSLLRSDGDAVHPNGKFLRSIGIGAGSTRKIALYALKPDWELNLRYASDLRDALQEAGVRPSGTWLTIRGADDETGGALQNQGDRYGYGNVLSFRESELAARLLMQKYPPCDSISFREDGTAAEDFDALVVGFGQTGQAVLKHLIMNGQFEGSEFHAAVFASDYRFAGGLFGLEARAMLDGVDFYESDGRSAEMIDYLLANKDRLRYIVAATGSDRINNEIMDEFRHLLKRVGCGASLYTCSRTGIKCYNTDGSLPELHKIFVPELLAESSVDRMAMALNHIYNLDAGRTAEEDWALCDPFSRLSSRASADYIPALLSASHKTAEWVRENDWKPEGELLQNLAKSEHRRWCAFHLANGFRPMTDEEFDARAAAWREKAAAGDTSFRILKDMEHRVHGCLVTWEELDALSAKENAVTGGTRDYKQADVDNVENMHLVLVYGTGEPEETQMEGGSVR